MDEYEKDLKECMFQMFKEVNKNKQQKNRIFWKFKQTLQNQNLQMKNKENVKLIQTVLNLLWFNLQFFWLYCGAKVTAFSRRLYFKLWIFIFSQGGGMQWDSQEGKQPIHL